MSKIRILASCLVLHLWLAIPAGAATNDIAAVIEGFMARQFPGAHSHMWVINNTDRPAANEMVVDLNAIVVPSADQQANESRFLLLIVEGRLAATQNIPLDSKVDCKPDSA